MKFMEADLIYKRLRNMPPMPLTEVVPYIRFRLMNEPINVRPANAILQKAIRIDCILLDRKTGLWSGNGNWTPRSKR